MIVSAEELQKMFDEKRNNVIWDLILGGYLDLVNMNIKERKELLDNVFEGFRCDCAKRCEEPMRSKLEGVLKEYLANRDFNFVIESGILDYKCANNSLIKDIKVKYKDFLLVLNDEAKTKKLLDFLSNCPSRYDPNEVDDLGETILFKMERERDIMHFIKIYIYDACAHLSDDEHYMFDHYLTNLVGDYWIGKTIQGVEITANDYFGSSYGQGYLHHYQKITYKSEEKNIPLLLTLFDPTKKGFNSKGIEQSSYAEKNPNSKFVADYNSNLGELAKKLSQLINS